MNDAHYEFGPFRLDPGRRELHRGTTPVPATPKVFDTLVALVERRGRVARKPELMAALWPNYVVGESNLSQNVFTLRKLLGEPPDGRPYIVTVPRLGYRFVGEVREVAAEASSSDSEPPPPEQPSATRLRVTVQVLDARTDRALWSGVHEHETRDAPGDEAEIAAVLARHVARALSAPACGSQDAGVGAGAAPGDVAGAGSSRGTFSALIRAAIVSFRAAAVSSAYAAWSNVRDQRPASPPEG